MALQDRIAMRDFYDSYGEDEWLRLEKDVPGRVSFEVHKRFLARFISPGMRVLEIGAGPGRFTLELANLGATVVVTDFSPIQLELNRTYLAKTDAESVVESRELLDVCDTSRYRDGEFDAVVAFGGPLSYAFEAAEDALRGLLRVTRPTGPVIASVMSTLGTWRYLLPAVAMLDQEIGEDANDAVLKTGDLRLVGFGHMCQMFRSSEIQQVVQRCGAQLEAMSASNWASLGDTETLLALESDQGRWMRFLENEIEFSAEPGALDGGTHILFAASLSYMRPE
jgi:SAM-dependent methyltransferase